MKYNFNSYVKIFQKGFLGILTCLVFFVPDLFAGKHNLDKGTVSITLPAPVGQLLAVNEKVSGFVESITGVVQFDVDVEGFDFISPTMPDPINKTTTKRFREYYLETDQFPTASFKGKIKDLSKVNFAKEGTYNVEINGLITIHGEVQEIFGNSTIIVDRDQIRMQATIVLPLASYKVRAPEVVRDIFFKEVNVEVDFKLKR